MLRRLSTGPFSKLSVPKSMILPYKTTICLDGSRIIRTAERLRFAILNGSVERDNGGDGPGDSDEERNTNEN